MAVAPPRRRHSDGRPPLPVAIAPTPAPLGPADAQAVQHSIEAALEVSRRLRRPVTLVALQVIAQGPAAEKLLVRMADIVKRTVRESDGVWRDGTTTIVVLLADADGPKAEPALARIRLRLKAEGVRGIGMGRATPAPGIGAEALLGLAHGDTRQIS
jgi:hypothetical protein